MGGSEQADGEETQIGQSGEAEEDCSHVGYWKDRWEIQDSS